MKKLFLIPLLFLISALMILPLGLISNSEENSDLVLADSGDYVYTYPNIISLKTTDSAYTFRVTDGMILESYTAYFNGVTGGKFDTNFPTWITYNMGNGHFDITIKPGTAISQTTFWTSYTPSGYSFDICVYFDLVVTGSDDAGGGDIPDTGTNDHTFDAGDYTTDTNTPYSFVVDDALTAEIYTAYCNGVIDADITSNLPSWISYDLNRYNYMEITITPALAVDTDYYICIAPDNAEFKIYIYFHLTVDYVDPNWGDDRPTDPDTPDEPEHNKIYIPLFTIWNYIADLLSNITVMILFVLMMILSSLLVRRDNLRRGY